MDEQCRQRLKRFYALDYTEQDFSDNLNSPAIQEAQLNQTTRNTKDEAQCQDGNLRCLLTNLDDYSRIMDELSYQLDVSETFTYSDEASSDENIEQENFEDFQLDLCHSCAQSLPVELENCLQRWRMLLLSSS